MVPKLRRLFPNASADFIALNPDAGGLPAADPQPAPPASLVGRLPGKAARHPRVVVGYRAFLVRPFDADNLAGSTKFVTDALVRSGLIHGDAPEEIEIRWSQERVAHYTEEKCLVTISHPFGSGADPDRDRKAATDENAAQPKNRRKIK